MGKLKYNEREGYSFISDNGIEYWLFEGKSLCGETTSDILYIHLSYEPGFFEEIMHNNDINELVGWFYGATIIKNPEYRDEYIEDIEQLVNKYEEKYPEIISYFNPKKKYKVIKEFVVEVEANDEDEATELAEYIFATNLDNVEVYPYIKEV